MANPQPFWAPMPVTLFHEWPEGIPSKPPEGLSDLIKRFIVIPMPLAIPLLIMIWDRWHCWFLLRSAFTTAIEGFAKAVAKEVAFARSAEAAFAETGKVSSKHRKMIPLFTVSYLLARQWHILGFGGT